MRPWELGSCRRQGGESTLQRFMTSPSAARSPNIGLAEGGFGYRPQAHAIPRAETVSTHQNKAGQLLINLMEFPVAAPGPSKFREREVDATVAVSQEAPALQRARTLLSLRRVRIILTTLSRTLLSLSPPM